MTPESMYRLAYWVLIVGTSIETLLFFFYGLLLMFYTDDPRELREIRENFIATTISLLVLMTIWATSGRIIDWLLGI